MLSFSIFFLLVAADGEEVLGDLSGCEVGVVIGQVAFMGEVLLRL